MNRQVTVYSNGPSCQQCVATERWLNKRGIEHETILLSEHPEKAKEFLEQGHTQAPVVVVENLETDTRVSWSGFNVINLKGVLG